MSYTQFEYSDLKISSKEINRDGSVHISFNVRNSGDKKGKEVAQLYLNDELSSVVTPLKKLRGFEKIELSPGETKAVSFTLASEDLMLLNRTMEWVVEPGKFNVLIGSSSEDIRLNGSFMVK
ncbi:Beta-glucosidase BoGH3A [bioreactor metagenome]|uniref:Beta-glucosidase BoGH3A n=1 Tax=bioreactor metagenome TaxID=1076179 RepID=A0A645HGS3_9ZZZZ